MINQIGDLITGITITIFVMILVGVFVYIKSMVVVPFNEIHVVSSGKKTRTFDGRGRYAFLKFWMGRTVIPKHVLDIEPGLLDLHDCDNLPFGVEISVKVQVTDPQKAAATLTRIDHSTVAKVVEDTVMSAARSIAMERTILDIMKKREEIESQVYKMVADALGKLGLSAIIFDIKNIRDMEDTEVIKTMERVKIAELRKNARISESIQNSQAIEVEVEQEKLAKVKVEQMQQEKDMARLLREQETAIQQIKVEEEHLKLEAVRERKQAEISREKARIKAEAERDQKMIEAQAQADSISLQAKAESEAIKLKAEAEAEAIKKKGLAEAEVLEKKNKAMGGNYAAQIELSKIMSVAQIDSAGKIAEALGQNNKIMYIPVGGENNLLSSFMPKLDAFMQSGVADQMITKLKKKEQVS